MTIKRTKINLAKWVQEIWHPELQLGFIEKSFDDPKVYQGRLSNIIRKAIENFSAEELVTLANTLDIDLVEKLWSRTLNRMGKDGFVQAIVIGKYGYDTEEDVWKAMEYDMSDKNKGAKTWAWYAFWRKFYKS